MKPSLSVDFLRGILFAFVVHCCYIFANALWAGLFPRFQPYQAGSAALLLFVYVILLGGLLFRPRRSARAVFVFLMLLCVLQIGSGIYWFTYPLRALPQSPFTAGFFASLLGSIVATAVAYAHFRARHQHNEA